MPAPEAFNALLLVTMGAVLLLALVSAVLRNRFIASEPIFALAIGAIGGPSVLDWVDLRDLTKEVPFLLEELARIVLAIAILTACLRVGWSWLRLHLRDIALILLVGLPLMWMAGFAVLEAALPTPVLVTLLIAAVIAPTDPVLAQAVVTSASAEEKVPADLRHLLSAESAANDGFAFLFVMACIVVVEPRSLDVGTVAWLLVWEVLGALIAGAALGWLAGRLMKLVAADWATQTGLLTASTALALVTLSGVKLLGMDGIFGVFGAGMALSAVIGDERQARQVDFNHTTAQLFQLPILVVLGTVLPFGAWLGMGWPLLIAVVLVLLVRRLPMMLVLSIWLRAIPDWRGALFAGWFGPIGVAALFYAALAIDKAKADPVLTVATAIITGSILAHGLTDTVGAHMMGASNPPRRR